jgi:hypothetical protein
MSALDLTLGCIYIGVILNVWLYGFTCVQVYIYFTRYKNDRAFMRHFVAFLFAADTINTGLDIVFLYKYLVTNYGNLSYATLANNEFATDPLCVSVIGFATQMFFAWRVWRLIPGRWNWLPPVVIFLLGLLSFLGALGTTIGVVIVRKFAEFQKFESTVIIWLACTAAADVVVTISLITTLRRAKTGFTKTDDIITRLIRNTLQTGLLTSSFAVIDLILFLASTSTLHLIFNLPLSKLYVNSLLSTLNARNEIFTTRPQFVNTASNSGNVASNVKHSELSISFNTASSQTITHKDSCLTTSTNATASPELEVMRIDMREENEKVVTPVQAKGGRLPSRDGSLHRFQTFLQPWSSHNNGQQHGHQGDDTNILNGNASRCSPDVQMVTVHERYESALPNSDAPYASKINTIYSANPSLSDFGHASSYVEHPSSATSPISPTFSKPYEAAASPPKATAADAIFFPRKEP